LAALASLTDSLKKLYPFLPTASKVALDGSWKSEPFELYGSSPQSLALEVKEVAEGKLAGFIRFYDSTEMPASPEYEILQGKRESNKVAFSIIGGMKRTPPSGGPLVAVAESFSGEVSENDFKLVYERDGYTPISLVAHRVRH
jgi:hypothetical protein